MSATPTTDTPLAPEATPPRSRRKLLLIVAAAVIIAGGAGGYLFVFGGGASDAAATPAEPVEGEVVDVATLTVNVSGAGMRYARVGFAVVLSEGADPAVVQTGIPLLKDAALTEIGRYSAEELTRPEGVEALRTGLSTRAQALYPDGEVVRAVLTELVVQ